MTSDLLMNAAGPIISTLVEKLIVPKFKAFLNSAKVKSKELFDNNENYFEEYYKRMYEKYSIINTLVFHNSQRKLKDIYVTQSLIKETRFEEDEETIRINRFPEELVKRYHKILITDTAGMGKSTIMKRMFVDLIENGLTGIGIPIYIELNKLSKHQSILTEIKEELNSLSKKFDNDLLLRFIQTGGFIFFMDGYDEISIADRTKVTNNIQKFISKAGTNNYYILTSRPDSGLSSFGDFQSFTIQPLIEDEAYELLRKYDLSKGKELSSKLVETLESGQYITINEFLQNPLLVSLLFTAYDYNRSIPFEKHRFYGVVFDAYFEKHDNTKPLKKRDKHSGLNYDGFDSILRYIGYDCLIRTGVKFNQDTILITIRKAKDFCGIHNFSEHDFLEDLVSTVPLFCKEGTDYKWVHKSLLEYFSARFIFCDAKQNQDTILTAIYKSDNIDKYINMLDIYCDIDPKGFDKNFTLPFCERFICFYKDNYYTSPTIEKSLIDDRISGLFNYRVSFVITSKDLSYEEALGFFPQTDLEHEYSLTRIPIQGANNGFVYYTRSICDNLTSLIFLKVPSITIKKEHKYVHRFYIDVSDKNKGLEYDTIYVIDNRTGDSSAVIYKSINSLMDSRFGFLDLLIKDEQNTFLDYQACEHKVKTIKMEMTQSDDISELLPK